MKKFKLASVLRLVALALIITVAWALVRDRFSPANWHIPVGYAGDATQITGWIKAASEGDYIPFWGETVTRLGAPYQANWNDYPMYEKILTFFLGMVARFFGLAQACNLGVVLGNVTAGLSFYLCCRLIRYARVWSFAGAILFAFTYFNFLCDLGHLLLAYTYTLPFAVVSCWIVMAARGMRLGDRLSWVCLISAAVMGLSNPYNLNMYVQLLGFSLLTQFIGNRRRENIKVGLIMIGVVAVGFIAINIGTLAYQWSHGKNGEGVPRNYFESELYALKPIEFLIPPSTHNSATLASIGDYYSSQLWVRGELFSAYLGVIGMAGLLWLFGECVVRIIKARKTPRRFPAYALQATWVIFYSVIGGVNCVISLAGIQLFRASSRYSMFIATLVLLFLVSRLSILSRKWSPALTYAIAVVAVLAGMYDQMPRPTTPEETAAIERVVESDRAFSQDMEAKLPLGGMVYQLPVIIFPEAMPTHDLDGYDMLRPYFHTKRLRFSFGSVRGRTREDWQGEVERMPVPQMVNTLEKYGFSAIFINRRGYADHAEGLIKELAADGKTQIAEDERHEQVCVALNPSPTPVLPQTDRRADIVFRSGWSAKETGSGETRQWSRGDAKLSFFSLAHYNTAYKLTCAIGSISARHVSIEMKGREIWSGDLGAGQGMPVNLMIDAKPGNNYLEFKTDQKAVKPAGSRVPLAFTLVNLQITRSE